MPAKTASIPRLVPESLLTEANSLSWGTQTLVGMLGLSISAGVLGMLYVISPKYFYVSSIGINAVSFAISAAFLVRLPSIVPQREHHEVPHPWQDFKDGLRFVNRFHELKVIIALLSVFRLMIAPFFVFYLAMNDKWFGGKPQTIVWLEIFFSGGMLAATLAIGRWKIKRPLLWFANGLAAVGVTVLVMAWCRSVWPFAVLQVIAGLGVPPSEIPVTTYLQRSVQDSYRGRVNSVRETVSVGIMPLGMVLGGVLIDRIGIQGGFILMGAGTLAACLFGLLDPRFRSAQMPPLKDAPSVGSPDLGVPSHA